MSEWVSCGTCGLKHRLRGDGQCPRCGQSIGNASGLALGGNGPVGSFALAAPAIQGAALDDASDVALAIRMAGWILIANVVMGVLAVLKLGFQGADSPLSIVVDAIVGWKLLSGASRAKGYAIACVLLGALLWSGWALARGAPADAAIQLLFSGSLLGLLVGEPGKARVWVSGVVGIGLLLLMLIGLMVINTHGVR